LSVSIGSVHANLLINGSFETPVIPPPFLDFGPGGEPPGFGWTVTTNTVDINRQGQFGWTAPEFDGLQSLDLVGFGSTGGIEQTFATTPGQQYTLFFAYANNPGPTSPPSVSADVTVRSGATTLLSQSITHSTSTTSNFNWTPFDMEFTATGTSATLAFNETVGGGNGGIFLDAVSVDLTAPPPPAVPEPATIFLLGTGLAALGLVRRPRSAKLA
jgi:hypothetical protein